MTLSFNRCNNTISTHKSKCEPLNKDTSVSSYYSIVKNVHKITQALGTLEIFEEYTLAAPIIRA